MAMSEDGGHKVELSINVDYVHLAAHGLNMYQNYGESYVSFISSITVPLNAYREIKSIHIIDERGYLLESISYSQQIDNKVISTSKLFGLGISGQSLNNYVSGWKFVYTYRLSESSEFKTKEVFINGNLWNENI